MPVQHDLTGQLLAVLDQGRRLLDEIGENLYRRSPKPIASSTVGEHVRHVLDAVQCLLGGIESGSVDYDRRERDEATETQPAVASQRIVALSSALERRELNDRGPLRVRADAPKDCGDDEGWNASTVGRELMYVVSHTIHHFALIAMILRHHGFEPAEDFGVAPSTLEYWKEVGRCAPLVG